MDLTITSSTSKARGPSNKRKNVAAAEKQLESMGYCLTQERGRWPFLTPRLENSTDKTQNNAPPLIRQVWEFLEGQLEVAETTGMTVGRFVTAANEVTIGGFRREHAKDELKTRNNHEILRFLIPCWEKGYMARVFFAKDTIFEAFVQELLNMPINLLLALYLVYPRYLFNMGPAYMFSRGVETLRTDGYLTLVLLTHGEQVAFHRLMKYGEPLSMGKTHPSTETYSCKCTARLKTLLVEYLLLQNRYLTGEERNPKTREEWKEANNGIPLLTDLCFAMRSDPLRVIRGLGEVVTCIYGPAMTYAFSGSARGGIPQLSGAREPDKYTRRNGVELVLRARMSNTVLFGKAKDPELVVFNFREQLQCRMGAKREGPIETYPKFWNLNPLTADKREILRIPAWKASFELVKRELEMILEREILPTTVPEFPMVRRMTLGMNSPLVVTSLYARAAVKKQQKEFTDGWDPLFIVYSAAVHFHTCEIKINSWTTQAKKMRGSMLPKFEVRDILRKLDQADLENMLPVWDDGRMIVVEGHIALKDEMKLATRKYRAPQGLEQLQMKQEEKELDAAGSLYVALSEYKKPDLATTSPLSVGIPGDKRGNPVEDRFKDALERRTESEERESMDETLREAGEEIEVENTPDQAPTERDFTTH